MYMPAKKEEHECPTCGKDSCPEGHLCVPVNLKDTKCEWCGALIPNERHLCSQKAKETAYICNSCGRTAVEAKYLCQPQRIH
jgi:hypothetical protein